MMSRARPRKLPRTEYRPGLGLARALSKLGYCSRSEAVVLVQAGRVTVNGRASLNAAEPVDLQRDQIAVDASPVTASRRIYIMLNKPRGLVTTASDEKGRETVFSCFESSDLPVRHLAPVGRLDQASEGLLLFTNDTRWAATILAPSRHLDKTYYVQVDSLVEPAMLHRMTTGITEPGGELLRAKSAQVLRQGTRNSWLEIILDEGKNRQVRRLCAGLGLEVLRLIRIAIGSLELGDLPKGTWRELTPRERDMLK